MRIKNIKKLNKLIKYIVEKLFYMFINCKFNADFEFFVKISFLLNRLN